MASSTPISIPARRILSGVGVATTLLVGAAGIVTSPANASVDLCTVMDAPVYNRANPGLTTSLLTRSVTEAQAAAEKYGFTTDRGITGRASGAATTGLTAVTRLYNAKTGDFVWSPSASATAAFTATGYAAQGVNFYASPTSLNCTTPVYSFTKGGKHQYVGTGHATELKNAGWVNEGAVFHLVQNGWGAAAAGGRDAKAPKPRNTTPSTPTTTTPTTTTPTTTTPTTTTPTTITPTTPAPAPAPTTKTYPGVPTGLTLKPYVGDLVITTPGTVIDGLDIKGFVTVKATDVTIRNSIVRGGIATNNRGLVTNYGFARLVVEDTTIKRDVAQVWIDGVKGSDFTLRRVHIVGGVDNVKVQGDNVRIEDSLLENTDYFANDPNQGGTPTHNDNIQVQRGNNLVFLRNTIRGGQNFAILLASSINNTTNVTIDGNYLSDGHCSMKIEERNGWNLTQTTIKNTRFGTGQAVRNCAINQVVGTEVTFGNNVWAATGAAVNVVVTNS